MDLSQCDSMIVFGGSFDPPQVAHVQLPELVRQRMGADVVVYVPAAVSPLKQERRLADPAHRLAMLELALSDQARAAIVTDELDRAADRQPSYTIDTLEALRARYPKAALRLLIGADQLAQFDRWREPERIIKLAEPVVMVRPPATRESVLDHLPSGYDRATWSQRLIDVPALDVSSTEVRRRTAAGQPIDDLVPPHVGAYIREHGLYGVSAR